MKNLELSRAGIRIGVGERLFWMLGLNVLEDEGLAMETAAELKRVTLEQGVKFVFKASFDKANRSSIKSFRGPGIEKGLKILEKVKAVHGLPVITDVHEPAQCEAVARVAEVVQIPAFLCRQTDLVVAAARAVEKSGGLLHVKKGQFLAPWDARNIVSKIREAVPSRDLTILCERGVSFGYNNLVVDMLGFGEMAKLGVPVTIDATHAVQLPGVGRGAGGEATATGGRREGVEVIAAASVAAGTHGVFLEFHPEPDKAKCDGPSALALREAGRVIGKLEALHRAITSC
ncbi:MAG: 3-deoxy-8-phosphooctulonate synthase [Bdellovibrionales bacterium]|nr:3-deoxy-8-phosphooctulonate synthase [Bdellovibrionales bacterium]